MSLPETNTALEKSFDIFTRDSDTVMMLMDVEEALRAAGKGNVADKLDKLQRDITGWYAGADTATLKGDDLKKLVVDTAVISVEVKQLLLSSGVENAVKLDELQASMAGLHQDVISKKPRILDFVALLADVFKMLSAAKDDLRSSGQSEQANKVEELLRNTTSLCIAGGVGSFGELVQPFIDEYEPLTASRLNRNLREIWAGLPEGDLKRQFVEFMVATIVPEEPAAISSLPLKSLFALAEASEVLNRVQQDLIDSGRGGYAKILDKLQQDVGTMVARAVGADNEAKSAKRDFAMVTTSRATTVLQETYAVAGREMQFELTALLDKLELPKPTAAQLKRSNLRR